jgi:hypothetical protein
LDPDLLLHAENCELAAQLSNAPDVAARLTRLAHQLRQEIALAECLRYCEAEDASSDTAQPAVR